MLLYSNKIELNQNQLYLVHKNWQKICKAHTYTKKHYDETTS